MSNTKSPKRSRPVVRREVKADNNPLLFATKFLKHGTRISSVAPSSRPLARALCRDIDKTKPQIIVELGAGTGPVTQMIVEQMHPESTLVVSEIDPDFCEILRKRFPHARVVEGDAGQLSEHLGDLPPVDVILCCLPTPSLPEKAKEGVLKWIASQPQATFAQLTVIPWVFKPVYKKIFHKVDFDLVVRNIPPGGVYHCRQPRMAAAS